LFNLYGNGGANAIMTDENNGAPLSAQEREILKEMKRQGEL
jgi:hypothetical protein